MNNPVHKARTNMNNSDFLLKLSIITSYDLKAAALFHSLIKSHPFMDGTKRTALAAALYFLERCGYLLPQSLPLNHVVEFCIAVAEENLRLSRGENLKSRSISDIAEWLQKLLNPTTERS